MAWSGSNRPARALVARKYLLWTRWRAATAGEDVEPGQVLRGEQRQLSLRAAAGGATQAVEEGGRVGVGRVQPVPQAAHLPAPDVVGDQGGLAGPRRPADPPHTPPERLFQSLVQPHPLQYVSEPRGNVLGIDSMTGHSAPVSRRPSPRPSAASVSYL